MIARQSILVALGLLALSAIGPGCTLMRPPENQTVLRLSVAFPAQADRSASPSLSIAPVEARGLTGDRRYAYIDRAAPNVVRQAETLFWEEPPSITVERAVVDGLRARFASVGEAKTLTRADQRLFVRLDRFEELTGLGEPPQAVVAFDVTTVGIADQTIAATRRYCAATEIEGSDPSSRADAFASALHSAVDQLAQAVGGGAASAPSC